jgi:DNA-binding transcriptional LysR family regulator
MPLPPWASSKDLEALMAEHVGLQKGRIDLAVVSTAKYFIPMLLVRFGKLFKGIDIQLNIDNRENMLGLLARNEADLVVMGRAPANLDCEAIPFATNPLAIVSAPDHTLVRRKQLPFSALGNTALWCARKARAPARPWSACLPSTRRH